MKYLFKTAEAEVFYWKWLNNRAYAIDNMSFSIIVKSAEQRDFLLLEMRNKFPDAAVYEVDKDYDLYAKKFPTYRRVHVRWVGSITSLNYRIDTSPGSYTHSEMEFDQVFEPNLSDIATHAEYNYTDMFAMPKAGKTSILFPEDNGQVIAIPQQQITIITSKHNHHVITDSTISPITGRRRPTVIRFQNQGRIIAITGGSEQDREGVEHSQEGTTCSKAEGAIQSDRDHQAKNAGSVFGRRFKSD